MAGTPKKGGKQAVTKVWLIGVRHATITLAAGLARRFECNAILKRAGQARRLTIMMLPAAMFLLSTITAAGPIPAGNGRIEVETCRGKLTVFTYKPPEYRDGPLIVVCHGVLRNAEEYRDHARDMAKRFGAIVAAPHFPDPPFSIERYQKGGLVVDGEVQPLDSCTWFAVPEIVDAIRRREARPEMKYYFIGHSGGAQFLIRLAGYVKSDVERIVVANPGTYLRASREMPFPFGFGGLSDELNSDDVLRRYLAQPITIYLGDQDTERDEHLDVTEWAERQGRTRYERGQNAFREARELAETKGWPFHWRLVIAPGVGHDHEAMFDHERCKEALFGPIAE
jgi:poly(3-hydroxybutyrate) depolymerase